ncbi:serine/threonine-protein kinase [Micromonospora sp. WMMD812]|uniref:serine/threonine-protein kinase n=1 Tax=Micromonospora sp. WMMD812 TaxID=3015152 RepID=UPI00248BB183|nr:serine/threonine-protein kinase [Micromonospora sp. WMMD812]WBB71164.1 protein kinase [Micromonospora sp. WMMD812]
MIAGGGMGDVWRAVDETLDRCVAVKLLHPRLVSDAGFGERFRREARAMAALRHPGVAQVYDYGEMSLPGGPDLAYIVMECVQGQPLSERIAEVGRLDTAEALSVAAQIARALQAAHDAGVVHRDVKPHNLIIEPDGHVVLVDFGVAVTQGATSLTAANQVVGTALYMAPEQVAKNATTPAIDVYALGAVVYHCLAGRPPYQGDNAVAVALRHLEDEPPPLPEDIPAEVRELVATAMAKEPTHRFRTAGAMAAAAQALADSYDRRIGAITRAASTGSPTVRLAARQRVRTGAWSRAGSRGDRAVSRGNAALALLLGSVAAVAAVLVIADPTGMTPGQTGRPSSPPAAPSSVSPPQGGPGPGGGGGEPETRGSAGVPVRAPGSPTPTATRPAAESAAGRPTPSDGSSSISPRPTTSEGASQGPTATPTGGTTADPTEEPTADPTEEPTAEESAAGGSAVPRT